MEAAGQQRISRLLIVEDDNAQRRTLTDVMRAEHFEVLCCGTAAEALQHVEKGGFGVAIVDLGLPDLPGAKLLEKIRAMSDQVRVIIHTGYGSFDSAKAAVNLGAFAYVEKLSDPAELIGHVHRAFQERLRSYADELEREIAKRKRAEEGLRKAHDDLEIRVSQRTSELATANEYLRTEITERRRTEEKLRDSRRQYQVLAEVSPVGVFHTDSGGNCLYVNERWCKIAGRTAEEAQGEGWACGLHPEDRERVFKEWYEAAREASPFQSEYRYVTRDGATTWVLGQARPERDRSGEISGYVGTITDITERKRAEQELRVRNIAFQHLHDIAVAPPSEIVQFCDSVVVAIAKILNASHATIEWTTRSHIEVISMSVEGELVHGGKFALRGTPCENVYRDHKMCIYYGSLRDLFPDDEFFQNHPMEAYVGAPLLASDEGEVFGIINIMHTRARTFSEAERKIVEIFGQFVASFIRRKRAEEALRKAYDKLEIRVRERTAELSEANERLRTEITERTRAEQAVRESEDRFRAIADYTYDWETWVGPDGKVLWINPAVERMTGYTVKECLAMPDYPRRMVHEDDRQNIPEAFSDSTCQCTSGNDVPFRIRCKDGTSRWGTVSWQPIHRGDGVCLGIRSSVRDITDRKRAEEQVKTHQAELAHASRLSSMGEMMSGLAHELNQPLGAICTYADACKRMLGSGSLEAVAETVDKLAGQAERAGKIIRRVQRFVRKGKPHRSTVDVNDIIRETIRMVELEARLEDIAIALDLCDRAPAVQGDPIQIQQVILNLLRNALDAIGQAEAGHHKVTIQSSMVEGVSVLVRVCDTGVGLDGEAAERIFDAFYTTKPDGMGMGLSISRSIVEAHGGKLHVTPNRERGATFHLLLPAKEGVRNVND